MALIGLEGVKAHEVACDFITRSSQIRGIIKKGNAVTAAGYNGAINIWKDDAGYLRGEAMRHFISLDKKIFTDMKEVKSWADKWLKEINNVN